MIEARGDFPLPHSGLVQPFIADFTFLATRRRIAWIFSVEFLALGAVSGIMGSLLAAGFAALVLKKLLEIDFHPSVATHTLAVAIAALVAALAGWAASFRILGRKPLEILREE